MTTTAATARVSGIRWQESGRVASFQAQRLYGVTDGAGRWMSFDGIRPFAYDRKSTAEEVAGTVDLSRIRWVQAVGQ